jgi:phosphatidylinositol-4,5-bisphosphate 3-kinase catalytic subunit alpha/beta/delta
MAPFFSELWGHSSMPELVDIDCLLPNGILITIQCQREITLRQLKTKVWEENKLFSFINNQQLKHADNYVFVSVTQEAKIIEYYDDEKRICDLKLFYVVFKLVEVQGDLIEKSFNSDLSKAIGLYTNEIEQNKDLEIIEFRLELLRIIHRILNEQNSSNLSQNYKSLIDCIYTPYIEIDPSLLDVSVLNTANSLDYLTFSNNQQSLKNSIEINVHVMETGTEQMQTFSLNVSITSTPTDVVGDVIKEKLLLSNHDKKQIEDIVTTYKNSYILNVCGCDEILNGKFIYFYFKR